MISIKSLIVPLFFISCQLLGQSGGVFGLNTVDNSQLTSALNSGQHEEVRIELTKIQDNTTFNSHLIDYFEAVLSIRIDQNRKPALQLINDLSNQHLVNELRLELARNSLELRNFNDAIQWYSQSQLHDDEDLFYLANAYQQINNTDGAIQNYEQIKDPVYYTSAQWQLALLYWSLQENNKAITYFQECLKDPSLSNQAIPYLSSFYFEQKDFIKALQYAEQYKGKTQEDFVLKIKAVSNQQLKKNVASLIAYKELASNYPNTMDAESWWNFGQVAMTVKDIQKAKTAWNKAMQFDSNLKYQAAFQLGQLYIKSGDQKEALSSFLVALETDDPAIRQKSLLNLSKTSFELGLFSQAIQFLNDYQQQYPNQDKVLTNDLLVQSYFQSSDYEQTIAFIESNSSRTPQIRSIYQLVTFENGKRYFNDRKIAEAIIYLEKSTKTPVDKMVLGKSRLLLAEAYSYNGEYQKAIPFYLQMIDNRSEDRIQALYGLAYAQYNTRDYESALQNFKSLVADQDTPIEVLTESDVRIADCLFVLKQYNESIQYYSRLKNSPYSNYVRFQLAQLYYFTEEFEASLRELDRILENENSNDFKDQAFFLQGQLFLDQANYMQSMNAFDNIIKGFQDSKLLFDAHMEKSLAATNKGDYLAAEKSLKIIIEESGQPAMAKNALLGLQSLQNKGHEVTDFDEYFEKVAQSQPENNELINIAYEAAKAPYYRQQYLVAIENLTAFINKYPDKVPADAYYLLGDSYFRMNQSTKSITSFDAYLSTNDKVFIGRALDRRGQALISTGNTQSAIDNYNLWLQNPANARETYQARMGLIEAHKIQENDKIVLELIEHQMTNSWKPINADQQLSLIKSELYEKQNDFEKANDELIQIMNTAEGENAAIAHFRFAKIQALDSNYQLSNETLLQLIADYGSYPGWTQQAYLLLIDNYTSMGNPAQAMATAQSIISNSPDSSFVAKAKVKLSLLNSETQLSKTDSLKRKQ